MRVNESKEEEKKRSKLAGCQSNQFVGCVCWWYLYIERSASCCSVLGATVCGALAFYYVHGDCSLLFLFYRYREYSLPGPYILHIECTSESSGKKRLLFTGTSISITIKRVVSPSIYRTHNDYVGINESPTVRLKLVYNETAYFFSERKTDQRSVEFSG